MKWLRKYWWALVLIFVVSLSIPFLLDTLIFSNSYPSKVTNDGWAGFLGGYIGAIIGALTTIIAISLELKHNEKWRFQDELKAIRPYLCIQAHTWSSSGPATKDKVYLLIQNVGFHAACNLYLYEGDRDTPNQESIWSKPLTIASGGGTEMRIEISLTKTEYYHFSYFDIRGDRYIQTLHIEPRRSKDGKITGITSCITRPPELTRLSEDYKNIFK